MVLKSMEPNFICAFTAGKVNGSSRRKREMVVKKVLLLVFTMALGILSGCSSTTVHLHADALSEVEQNNIRTGLEEQGFSVKMRENEAPASSSVVLYYPHKGIEEDLRAIDNVLDANGLIAEHRYLTHTEKLGVHEYTAGNIGVYIVPAGQKSEPTSVRIRSVFPITMVGFEFVSTDCDKEHLYEFSDDGTMVVSDLSLPLGEMDVATLSWQSPTDDTVIISSGDEDFEYKKSQSHREHFNDNNNHVVTYSLTLKPTGYYRVPFGCSYKSDFLEGF